MNSLEGKESVQHREYPGVENLHPTLRAAAQALALELPALDASARSSKQAIDTARKLLAEQCPPSDPLDVFAFGSLAREELSKESDFDYLVVALGLPQEFTKTKRLILATEELRGKLNLKEPGATGMFGRVIAAADLTERIGLEQDTNLTHSLRILILQESVSIYQPTEHERLLRAILERYLVDYLDPKAGIPRFLLNDLVRYWRTMAVDYQAKRWEEWGKQSVKWGLRYLKLRVSRKLTFAGTLASLLLTNQDNPATTDYLTNQFRMPPLARLAQLHTQLTPLENRASQKLPEDGK